MLENALYPLRTIVGDAVDVRPWNPKFPPTIRIVEESREAKAQHFQYVFHRRASLSDTTDDPIHPSLLPPYLVPSTGFSSGTTQLPIPPPPIPWAPDTTPVVSLFARATTPVAADARRLSVGLLIPLRERRLVGGIVLGGMVTLPQRIAASGKSLSNYGLPREMRIRASGLAGAPGMASFPIAFPDAEIAVTREELLSHSGLQVIPCDPMLTDTILVHLSDFPRIGDTTSSPGGDGGPPDDSRGVFGFAIPYFWIFEYAERTRYRPLVSAGILAARMGAPTSDAPAAPPSDLEPADHPYVVGAGASAMTYPFSAASIFGQQRTYAVPAAGGAPARTLTECFVSKPVAPGESITLYVDQAEEYARCVSGIRMLMPFVPEVQLAGDLADLSSMLATLLGTPVDLSAVASLPPSQLEAWLKDTLLHIPDDVDFCEDVEIRVFEVDPPPGVSPLAVPLDGKYATLVGSRRVEQLSDILDALLVEGVRFKRSSMARHFAIQLVNRDEEAGQFVVKGLQLVQSAHVSVSPRASRAQSVRAVRFRLIGESLGDDYAKIGGEGFNLTVERLVAGEPRGVLYRAYSLVDLLDSGATRVYANTRRRAVEDEQTDSLGGEPDNYEVRHGEALAKGWRKSQSGVLTTKDDPSSPIAYEPRWTAERAPGDFAVTSCQETRAHTDFLGPEQDDNPSQWLASATITNALHDVFTSGQALEDALQGQNVFFGPSPDLLVQTYNEALWSGIARRGATSPAPSDGWSSIWRGIDRRNLKITGLRTVAASPYALSDVGQQIAQAIDGVRGANLDDVVAGVSSLVLEMDPRLFAFGLLNSFGISVSAATVVSLSTSLGGSTIIPSVSLVNTIGSQGTIAFQANKSGYQYAQHRNDSFDETSSLSSVPEARSHRRASRREVDGTDTQRVRGGEVLWQGHTVDIVTGAIPLSFTLPATASRLAHRNLDETLRVRLGSGVGPSLSVDIWFDVVEEVVRDDY